MTTALPLYFTHAGSVLKSAFAALTAKPRADRAGDNGAVRQEATASGNDRAGTNEIRDPFRKI